MIVIVNKDNQEKKCKLHDKSENIKWVYIKYSLQKIIHKIPNLLLKLFLWFFFHRGKSIWLREILWELKFLIGWIFLLLNLWIFLLLNYLFYIKIYVIYLTYLFWDLKKDNQRVKIFNLIRHKTPHKITCWEYLMRLFILKVKSIYNIVRTYAQIKGWLRDIYNVFEMWVGITL